MRLLLMRFKLLIRLFRTAIQVDLLARGALVVPHSDGEDLHASLLRSSGADLGARAYRVSGALQSVHAGISLNNP